jgi:pullulanase/glycogen debranching enzyme
MDRNSYNSGDWFNRMDWTYTDNYFGMGAPVQSDNGDNWPLIKPRLANADIKPTSSEIRWAKDAFRDLLEIRASTQLFRLRTAEDVQERLRFLNTGPDQEPTVVVGHLDGRGLKGEPDDVLYFINVDKVAHTLTLDTERGKPYRLHPVHLDSRAADRRPAEQAQYQRATGAFTIPPRTALVYVTK